MNFYVDYFQRLGENPLMGKIFALLLVQNSPLSLQEIAEKLDLSKASISIQIRDLTRAGYSRKLPPKGDRKDYYEVNDRHLIAVETSLLRYQRYQVEELGRIISKLDPEQPSCVKKRLERIKKFYRTSCKAMERHLTFWKRHFFDDPDLR